MFRFLRKLPAFGLLFEVLAQVRLSVLLATMMLVAAIVVCSYFLLNNTANST